MRIKLFIGIPQPHHVGLDPNDPMVSSSEGITPCNHEHAKCLANGYLSSARRSAWRANIMLILTHICTYIRNNNRKPLDFSYHVSLYS